MKNKLLLIVAVLVGILAFWGSAYYLDKERDALYAGAEKIQVIAAARDMPAGAVLQRADLGLKWVYKSSVSANVFLAEDAGKIVDKSLKYPARKGYPIQWSQVDMPRVAQAGLAPIIQKRNRAISISISGAAAVSGLVKPNDHVDILGTFTFPSRTNPQQVESVTLTLMQDVTVLATGSLLARQATEVGAEQQQGGYSTVTFEVFPEEAELLVFAQQTRGQLYLTLRNPDDIYPKDALPSVNFDYLESELQKIHERRQLLNIRNTDSIEIE